VVDRFADVGARSPGFLGYLLYPTCLYAVSATRTTTSIKITVGVNPWTTKQRRHDIGELCARHGGGGHAVVGGVTLQPDELTRAQATIQSLVRELATGSDP
jgi:nanoRNase/pAp phosphatase (c-di-AMP/oligoRNAs hydrolase)